MTEISLIGLFLKWYLFEMPKEIGKAIKNFLKFGLHFFSLPVLFKTFFAYWHQFSWRYPRGFNPSKFLEIWISNQISRLLGMFLRSVLIIVAFFYEIFVIFLGISFLFLWFFLPLILFLGLIYGFKFLFAI